MQAHQAASESGFGPVTPAPPANCSGAAALGGAAGGGGGGGVAGALLPRHQAAQPLAQKQEAVEEESTMELYSQLIRCR